MKKDAYYFPHFIQARNDTKLLKLRQQMGWEGYGLYFAMLESLREQQKLRISLSDLPTLSYELKVSVNKIKRIIYEFDLFQIEEEKYFYSQRLIDYLKPYMEKSQRATDAINKRWGNTKEDTNVSSNEYSKVNTNEYTNNKVNNKRRAVNTKEPEFGTEEYWKRANHEAAKLTPHNGLNKK